MNREWAFRKSARHLLRQGVKSVNLAGNCVYRGRGGLKCALGILIPNSKYSRTLEGYAPDLSSTASERREVAIACGARNQGDVAFLRNLQEIHDFQDPCDWHGELLGLATRRGFSTAFLGKEFPVSK